MQLKWLNRLAQVKDDGTVQFEVPGDIKPESLDFGTGVVYNGATGEESVDATDVQDLPPLQIVMLIVGTRGDVQPFVAIGKRLQVKYVLLFGEALSHMGSFMLEKHYHIQGLICCTFSIYILLLRVYHFEHRIRKCLHEEFM